MQILGVITARGKSKGLKDKHCLSIGGKSLLWYTLHAARSSRTLNKIICSSDSQRILTLADQYGIEGVRRPSRYATDTSPIEEPLRHAVTYLKKKENYTCDIVVLLYGNVPYRAPYLIDKALALMQRQRADAVVSVSETQRFHPERLVVSDKAHNFRLYTKSISSFRRQDLKKVYFIDSGIVAFKTSLLFGKDPLIVSHYFKGYKVCAYVCKALGAWDVDNAFELEIAKMILSKKSDRSFGLNVL